MKQFCRLIITTVLLVGATLTARADDHKDSVLVEMFKWFNKAYASEHDFTEEGFARYFTDDIVFIVNGQKRKKGIKALTQRYNNLKARYAYIEIFFPFKEEERVGNKIFTYYVNRGWKDKENPEEIITHVMGYVEIKGGKIDLLNFVFADIKPEKEKAP